MIVHQTRVPDVVLLQGRLCVWCRRPLPESARANARACGVSCRKPLSRFRAELGSAPDAVSSLPRSLGFAELPDERRPGRGQTARALHVGRAGVGELLHRLEGFDSWALALSFAELAGATEMAPYARVGFMHRPGSPTPVDAVLFSGGSTRSAILPLHLQTRRTARQQATMHKPAQFWRWVFETLDVRQGDQFSDVYPGASGGRQAFEIYTLTTEGQRP